MPVKLRLQRRGRKAAPFYAIVAADSRAPRDGRYIEKIGFYNPVAEPARVYVDHDAAIKWLQIGAQPTNTVRNLLRHAGVTVKLALLKQGKTEEEIERIFGKWRAEKDAKSKKKVISVDIHGTPLEPVPQTEENKKEDKVAAPEPVVEKAPAVEEAVTEAPAEEVVAEAPAEEAVPEAPAEESTVEEAAEPAETPEEKPAEAPAEE